MSIKGHNMIRRDQKGNNSGVVCYVSTKICFNAKNFISNEIENILIELFILKTNPITAGILYKLPNQLKLLEKLSGSLNTLNILNEECHILEDLSNNQNNN